MVPPVRYARVFAPVLAGAGVSVGAHVLAGANASQTC